MGIVLALLLAQDLDALDDDDPAVREQTVAALAAQGSKAIPLLKKGLAHRSAEVRARSWDLLLRLPEFADEYLHTRPDYPVAARRWNAVIDCFVHKKPVPRAIWNVIGEGLAVFAAEELVKNAARNPDHSVDWILHHMATSSEDVLHTAASRFGIEDVETDVVMLLAEAVPSNRPPRLLERIAAAGADDHALEEVYATILLLQKGFQARWSDDLSDRDWNTVIRFLVGLRRRLDAPAAKPPASRKDALARVLRGPWIRGIADAVSRALSSDGGRFKRSLQEKTAFAPAKDSDWEPLRALYDTLLETDAVLGNLHFWADLLRDTRRTIPAADGLPPPTGPFRSKIEKGLDEGGRRVAGILLSDPPAWKLESHDGADALLREIARRVAKAAGP